MRIWLSKNSGASLRDQLATQFLLGVLSEDLKAGEKLPSVRELARRCHIHANTASAAYRDLEARGWVEFRKGSGVYVRDPRGSPTADQTGSLDHLIEAFFAQTRERGFSASEVRARVEHWLGVIPVSRLVVAEPEPELGEILVSELRERISIPVSGMVLDATFSADGLGGAAIAALVSRSRQLRAVVPPGVPCFGLRLRSVPEYLQGQTRPGPTALIGVASASPEILRRTRNILAAAALDPDGLVFRDAREEGWQDGLHLCEMVIADIVTARMLGVESKIRVFRVLSDSSVEELRRYVELVTDRKVSQTL